MQISWCMYSDAGTDIQGVAVYIRASFPLFHYPLYMSSIQTSYFHNTPRESSALAYDQYMNEATPKKLPGLSTESSAKYTLASNYTYSDLGLPNLYTSDNESPIKRAAAAAVKLPSFSSLMQSISADQHQPTLSFDNPMMNSLGLENANFRVPKAISAQLSPARDSEQHQTFLGIYNYSKAQFEDPYRDAIRRDLPSPLQLQQDRFGYTQFQMNGLQQLAHVMRTSERGPKIQASGAEKRFKCKICSRGFNTAGNLSRHKKVHTGEKKYACQYPGCESRFARSDSCMQHYRTHANENGYTSRRFKRMKTDEEKEEDRMHLTLLMS